MTNGKKKQFTIFISAVSTDFMEVRTDIARVLECAGYHAIYQESHEFQYKDGDTLVDKLRDSILPCDLVVLLMGPNSGSFPPAQMGGPSRQYYLPNGFTHASYTQWEAFIALKLGKQIAVFCSSTTAKVEQIEDLCQRRFVSHLIDLNKIRLRFETPADIPARVKSWVDRQWEDRHGIDLHGPIFDHVRDLRHLAMNRLQGFASEVVDDPMSVALADFDTMRNEFVEPCIAQRDKSRVAVIPHVLREIERLPRRNSKPDNLLVVAAAGQGKTTTVQLLLAEMSIAVSVMHWKVVPILADCVTWQNLFAEKKNATDEELLSAWLEIAIQPKGSRRTSPDPILRAMEVDKYRFAIVIDGLDELDPSARGSTEKIERLFRILDGLRPIVIFATSRPREELDSISASWQLRRVDLAGADYEKVKLLAERLLSRGSEKTEIRRHSLDDFMRIFTDDAGIKSKLFYLRPLARYFHAHPDASEHVSQLDLMQFERDSVVARLQVDLERRVRLPDRRSTKEDLHQLLLEVALESVSLDDIDQPAILTRERLKSLPTVEHFPRIVEMIDEHQDTVVERLLQILIYQAQEETEYYRLPHNEYRDFLLADGIFRWCEGKNGPLIDSQPAFQSRLVTTYLQLENVRNLFLPQIIAKRLGVNRRHFIDDFVMRMNGALQETKPANRTDSSAHAAALSFLMTINPPRNIHVIAKDRNFQRAWIERSEGRVRLPLGKDCTNAIFREARLPCAELSECNFDGADFDNADLTGASLSRSTFRKANLQNVAMGKSGTRETVLRGGDFAGSNWFNYRFQGIRGYFHFWDLEILNSRFVLAAGSRGQILMFDLTEAKLVPQQLLTTHDNNEIMDISRHPIEHDVIVTTCRDRTIRLFRITMFPQPLLTQIAHLSGLFQEDYPRRAQFSKSGNWLAIIARDSQVKFVPVGEGFRIDPGEVSVGRVHTGPVMCVAEEIEERVNQAEKNWDSFYTGGYDGRIAMWQDGDTRRPKDIWAKPVAITNSLRAKDGRTEIYRALAPNAERMGIWAGTEIDGSLQLIEFSGRSASVDIGLSHVFNEGIFSLAVHPETGQIAVGFGTGRVRVYRVMNPSQKDRYDWNRPVLDIETNGEIVRSLVFIESGNVVLAATWDACLYRFDLRAGRETDHYEYPSAGWMPEIDTDCFDFGTEDEAEALLRDVRGVSPRMKQYLVLVAKAKDRECQTRSRT